ncbi:hypothetical protein ES703_01222 [subsurface metagenome]
MAIKWSAVKVSEAMDEVEAQVILADQFIAEARVKVAQAQKIANLPQYIDQRLSRLDDQLERLDYIKQAITRVREDIPDGAIEAERERTKYGSTQSLI